MRLRLVHFALLAVAALPVAGCGRHGPKAQAGKGGLADPQTRLNAAGETPSWTALVRPGVLILTVGDTAPMTLRPTAVERDHGGASWSATLPGKAGSVALDVTPKPCRDSTTGLTYPLSAVAGVQGRRYPGCAAHPGQGLGPRS